MIVLADYTPTDFFEHPECKDGLFSPITESGAPIAPVEMLIATEAPTQLFGTIRADHQHIALWSEPIAVTSKVQCVGLERFNIHAGTGLLCRHFLTIHLQSDSAEAMQSALADLARINTAPATAILECLPFAAIPNPLIRRAFAFIHSDDSSVHSDADSLVHVVPSTAHVSPGHWTHGRLSFAAQALALQLSNQVLFDMLPTPDGRVAATEPGGADEYVNAVRTYLAHAWWPDFTLDPTSQLVAEQFYARTRLRSRVAEERETMRDVWAASEAASARLLNRVGLVFGTSAVVAAWFAIAASSLGTLPRAVIAGAAGLLTLGIAAYAPRLGRKK